jgi:hypothetical protein
VKRFIALTALAIALAFVASSSAVEAADATKIDVCCAWNGELSDGELTYSIGGASGATLDEMNDAVQAWASATGITLTQVDSGAGNSADIEIRFKRGGGTVQGLTRTQYDGAGFITSASISVSGMAFGEDIGAVHQITMHEMGHALGAVHADGGGVLMATTVNDGVDAITPCDLAAVMAAQQWWVNGLSAPASPVVSSVGC